MTKLVQFETDPVNAGLLLKEYSLSVTAAVPKVTTQEGFRHPEDSETRGDVAVAYDGPNTDSGLVKRLIPDEIQNSTGAEPERLRLAVFQSAATRPDTAWRLGQVSCFYSSLSNRLYITALFLSAGATAGGGAVFSGAETKGARDLCRTPLSAGSPAPGRCPAFLPTLTPRAHLHGGRFFGAISFSEPPAKPRAMTLALHEPSGGARQPSEEVSGEREGRNSNLLGVAAHGKEQK
ncbi:hypothetical protein SKAU_G00230600 [Synaphobranchus kaupii]|uniref:Uncharacterized protein n=1 Tax=Synaphobranchus kaupii TaxID=118154 RepID=A0A9Q1F5Z3_SYNKA|nr:hypothetical protein SKAU_G00230600 [Synaphobranchus kaupii]